MSNAPDLHHVCHILLGPYDVDSRVRNQTETLSKKYSVTVYCLKSGLNNDNERRGVAISRHGLMIGPRYFRYLLAYISIFFSVLSSRVSLIHCHDMAALPLGYLLSKIKRVQLIYNSHELWSKSHHNIEVSSVIKLACWMEVKLARSADIVLTVSPSINRYLSKHFCHEKVHTIMNIPSYDCVGSYDLFREELGINETVPIFLYQGALSAKRGIHVIADALERLGTDRSFAAVFLGNGTLFDELQERFHKSRGFDNIFILPSVDQSRLLQYTASADIGLHAIERTCLNHEYCLPNKLFEYVKAGIAVVCSDMEELKSFVERKSGNVF